ncbi:MAG: DUF4900 domain-containing protein [Kiritimatiellia bacterium]|jgi:hypothetical protein
MKTQTNSGAVLVAVAGFTALASVLAAYMLSDGITQVRLAKRQVQMEQTFYLAEGGAEQAVAYIRNGQTIPGVVTGSFVYPNNVTGNFAAVVVEAFDTSGAGSSGNTVSGSLNINPNNSPHSEFLLVKPDGTTITMDDLKNSSGYTSAPCVYYSGPAVMIRVKPKGNGNQNSLFVNGYPYYIQNRDAIDLVSMEMNVQVYNTKLNPGHGTPNGHWYLGNINGRNVSIAKRYDGVGAKMTRQYTIFSTGRLGNMRRAVILEGVQQQAWSRFALWYNDAPGAIWFCGDEVFNGPVHANTTVYLKDRPVFNELLSSTSSRWGSGSDLRYVRLYGGYWLSAPADTMATIVFTNLKESATIIVTGMTHMTISGTNTFITNEGMGWDKHRIDTPEDGLIYVCKTNKTGSQNKGGNIQIGGQLDGRMTVVADNNIYITNHLTYAVHPTNDSNNALGLIAQNDIVVSKNAPANLNIFAHLIACNPDNSTFESGFYVQNYNSRKNCGFLNVYGGLVENNRGAVGTTGGTGYSKNYTYDERFRTTPPPHYPTVLDVYQWDNWREKAL